MGALFDFDRTLIVMIELIYADEKISADQAIIS